MVPTMPPQRGEMNPETIGTSKNPAKTKMKLSRFIFAVRIRAIRNSNQPNEKDAMAMIPLIHVAMVGCPDLDNFPRNFGISPSIDNACKILGPPKILPKAEERTAPQTAG